jgi:hypothetical protein
MVDEYWYQLRVHTGFAPVVAQRLRTLNFEVFVPENNPAVPRECPQTTYIYCRFDLENRASVTTIPGVLDILGAPEPTPINFDWPSTPVVSRLRP